MRAGDASAFAPIVACIEASTYRCLRGFRQSVDISTYVHYAGAVPGTSNPANNWAAWDQNSTRAYFAGIYWQAQASYFGVDRIP